MGSMDLDEAYSLLFSGSEQSYMASAACSYLRALRLDAPNDPISTYSLLKILFASLAFLSMPFWHKF